MTNFVLDPDTDTIASVPRFSRPFQKRQYRDKKFMGGEQEWSKKLENSTTVYVGNLSCYTNEYQLYEFFSRCGSIKRIIMGLDRIEKKPCGFCFVEYDERSSALKSIKYLNRAYLDGREIKIDMDAGFQEGRQFGRGEKGGQVGDERRRERESGGGYANRGGINQGSGALLTRSVTIVACMTLISLLLMSHIECSDISADIRLMPFGGLIGASHSSLMYPHLNRYDGNTGRFVSVSRVRQAQITKQRTQFESDLAQFLVSIMKSAKPTLLKAFIKATLADKQLKETAIGLFFGTSDDSSDNSDDKDTDKDKDKDEDKDKDKDKENHDEDKETPKDDKEKNKERRKRKRGSKDKDKELMSLL